MLAKNPKRDNLCSDLANRKKVEIILSKYGTMLAAVMIKRFSVLRIANAEAVK